MTPSYVNEELEKMNRPIGKCWVNLIFEQQKGVWNIMIILSVSMGICVCEGRSHKEYKHT